MVPMERRNAKRLSGISEVTLTDTAGQPVATASIGDLSEGGILVTYIEPEDLSRLSLGQKVRFRFVVSTGEVDGTAEIVRKSDAEVGLRILTVDNEAGVPHLMGFLHSWLCGVD
jgi:hypothetical protein